MNRGNSGLDSAFIRKLDELDDLIQEEKDNERLSEKLKIVIHKILNVDAFMVCGLSFKNAPGYHSYAFLHSRATLPELCLIEKLINRSMSIEVIPKEFK